MLGAPDTLMYLTAALTCLGVIFGSKFEGAGGVIRQLWGFYHVFDATLQRSALAPAVASSMLALKAIYFFERRERIRKKDRENFGFWHAAEHLDVALFCMSHLAPRALHPVLMARIGAGLACCTIVAASHDLHTCNELIISGAAIMIVLFLVPHDGPAVALGPLALSSFHLALLATTLYAAALYSRRLPRRLRAVVECGVLYACEGQAGLSRWAVAMVIEQGFSQVMHPFVLLAPHIAQTWAAECTGWDVAGCIYQLTFLALFIMPAWNINFRHNTDPLLLALYYVVPLTSWARAAAVFLFFHVCATASFAAFSRSMWPASPEVLEAVPQVLRELFLKKLRGNSHSMQLSGFLVKPYAPLLTNENISFMQLEEAMLRHHQHSMVAASLGAAGASSAGKRRAKSPARRAQSPGGAGAPLHAPTTPTMQPIPTHLGEPLFVPDLIVGLTTGGAFCAAIMGSKVHVGAEVSYLQSRAWSGAGSTGSMVNAVQCAFDNEAYMARPPKVLDWYKDTPPRKASYRRVLVVDDTISTGRTMRHALQFVREHFPKAEVKSYVWRAARADDADYILEVGRVPLIWPWGLEND